MSKLFEESDDTDSEIDLKTDNSYAKNYDNWRQKEELNKLKTKYGEEILNNEDSSSSSSEDEDEDGEQITDELERDFLKTLASLKTKNPKIYDENVKFFTESSKAGTKKTQKKDNPMYIKDYERKLLLENKGQISDDDQNTEETNSMTYVEEQEQLKKTLKDALQKVDESDDEWGGMFKSRKKTDTKIKTEEEEYKKWLLGQKEDINDEIKNDLKPLKDYWTDPTLDENERFLRDYILNKRFLEPVDKDYVPTYEEIIHDSDEGLSEDEKQVEKQEEFEHKYNYRYEEPDEEFIKRYPRTIENSLRTQDDKRKIKRAELKERKQKEKQKKMEDVRQMHELKRKEIKEKIQKLKEITGNTDIAFDDNDIEDDFDPEAHDRRMQSLFNDEFYQGQEEEQKPEFPDLDKELEIENWDKYENKESNSADDVPHCEDDDFIMDCDYDPTTAQIASTSKGKKKRKRKTKFAEVVSEPKPTFNPEDKTYEEYLDEYYKLECEDIIRDVPCRFKYRKVVPNSFGLSIEEILTANDRELNRWCSLKKAVQYRPENVEKYDVIAFERKGRNEALKKKLLPSLFKEESTTDISTSKSNTRSKDQGTVEENNQNNAGKKRTIEKNVVKKYNEEKNSSNINSVSPTDVTDIISKKNRKKSIKRNVLDNGNNEDIKESDSPKDITKVDVKKKKKKKVKTSTKTVTTNTGESRINEIANVNNNINNSRSNDTTAKSGNHGKKRKRKNKNDNMNDTNKPVGGKKFSKHDDFKIDISDARLKAFGIRPKKFKNKLKYGQKKN